MSLTVPHNGTTSVAPHEPAVSALDRFRLDDRVVIVTGGSSGLGVAFAQACAGAGADVVVAARRADRLETTLELVRDAGRDGLAVTADVSSEQDCRRIVEETVERFGRLDVLVNNAGVAESRPAAQLTGFDFQRVLDVNVTACFNMARAAAEHMPCGSSIVNVSSVMGLTTIEGPSSAYSASKAAVLGLTRALAREWTLSKGIRVNAILPGFFPSEMTPAVVAQMLSHRLAMGRLGDPDELAAAVVFLASDASSYMTGAELLVDGGFMLT